MTHTVIDTYNEKDKLVAKGVERQSREHQAAASTPGWRFEERDQTEQERAAAERAAKKTDGGA